MFASIVSYGLAVGAVYALIGITYNVMFSASRVFSFTAGMLGMLGGVLGALFIARMGLPAIVGFVLVLACGAVLGLVTEVLTVRPVLKSIEQHLYVLSTLAFALMVQQLVAVDQPALAIHRQHAVAVAGPGAQEILAARLQPLNREIALAIRGDFDGSPRGIA